MTFEIVRPGDKYSDGTPVTTPVIPGAPTIGGFTLLPAKPGTCPECAVDHDPKHPHNQQSLYYQYHFYADHQRWPTWADALAHCDDQMKAFWKDELQKRGISV